MIVVGVNEELAWDGPREVLVAGGGGTAACRLDRSKPWNPFPLFAEKVRDIGAAEAEGRTFDSEPSRIIM